MFVLKNLFTIRIEIINIKIDDTIMEIKRTLGDKVKFLNKIINIDISKQFQTTDFGGELSQGQLKYCANDVIYLHKINEELNKILLRESRMELYQECLKFLKTRVKLDLALFKEDIWAH